MAIRLITLGELKMSIPEAKKYIKDFEQLGFGVFVHFGLYSILEKGEWSARLRTGLITKEDYYKLTKKFNPGNMENMVLQIKNSGAKYITLTTKHHDGFHLFDACGNSEFDVMHSAAGRDLVKEFVTACRKHDIVPFFYYATMEWWHPDFDGNFDRYLEYLRNDVKLLCTNYGKIGGLWFDGNWSKKGEGDIWQEDKLYSLIRKYQPDAMIITNTGLSSTGSVGHPEIDSVTYERGNARPINRDGMDKYISGEVCDSINMHWGIADDINYKSPMQILTSLIKSRSAGANYLFNVGPDSNGNIPQYPLATLNVIGKWINIFGNAVYNGRPYWYREDSSVFILKDDKHLYFFYINLARKGSSDVTYISGTEGMIKFNDIGVNVANIKWMDNNEQLDYSKDEDDLTVNFTGYDYGTDYCVRVAVGDIV